MKSNLIGYGRTRKARKKLHAQLECDKVVIQKPSCCLRVQSPEYIAFQKDRLIYAMLDTMYALGWDCGRMARVAARGCYRNFKRRAARLGIKHKDQP